VFGGYTDIPWGMIYLPFDIISFSTISELNKGPGLVKSGECSHQLRLGEYSQLFTSPSPNNCLRVPADKNQTYSQFRGKGRKFDFAHILMVDSLGYAKNYWIVFCQNILLFPRNMQITAPSYETSLRASHAKPHHFSLLKTIKYFCAMRFKCVLG